MLVAGAKSMRGGVDRATLRTWKFSGSSSYYVGNRVIPTSPNGHYYEVETIGPAGVGQTGASEPVWPTNGSTVFEEPFPGATTRITWRDKGLETASLAIGTFPNNQQGFGRISLTDVLSDYPMRYFVNETLTLSAGQLWTQEFVVHDLSQPVRIALVWTDPPAMWNEAATPLLTTSPLVNDLNLSVEVKQSGNCVGRYVGNNVNASEESAYFQPCTGGNADTANNVEIIRFFASSAKGDTTFTVKVVSSSGTSQDFGLVVWNAYDFGTITPPPAAPSNFVAVASSSTQVSLSWTASSGATSYDVGRSAGAGDPFVSIGTPSGTTLTDGGRSPLTTYIYRVRARNSTGVSDWSRDPATTILFTDPTLVVGVTGTKAVHLSELRQAVAAMRTAAGLGVFTWTDDPIVAQSTLIKAAHVSELRTALAEARDMLGLSPMTLTDGTLTPATSVVKAVHVQELRDGL
jgi:hypothetical protein